MAIELDTSELLPPLEDLDDEQPQPKERVFTFSPSQLGMYTRCGEQYRRRYIAKEIVPPAIAMIRGTAVHKGSEVNFKQKIESWEDLPKKDIVDASVQDLNDRVQHEGILLSADEVSIGKDKVIDQAQKQVVSLSGLYADHVAKKYQPRAVELTQKIDIPDSNIKILGRLDTLTIDDTIVDLKSATKKKTQAEFDGSPALTTYALTKEVLDGKPAKSIEIEVLVDKAQPEVQTISTFRNQDDYVATLNSMNQMAKGILAGVFTPAYGLMGAWWCSKTFCGYWSSCPYVPKRLR